MLKRKMLYCAEPDRIVEYFKGLGKFQAVVEATASDPQCGVARAAIQTYRARGERLVVVPQNLYEFWAVATRPLGPPPAGQNGLGMPPVQAGQWIRFFQRRFAFLPDHDQLSKLWLALVEAHGVTGFRAHDARLVAAMQSYAITRLLTFNAAHFRGLPVTTLDPASP